MGAFYNVLGKIASNWFFYSGVVFNIVLVSYGTVTVIKQLTNKKK